MEKKYFRVETFFFGWVYIFFKFFTVFKFLILFQLSKRYLVFEKCLFQLFNCFNSIFYAFKSSFNENFISIFFLSIFIFWDFHFQFHANYIKVVLLLLKLLLSVFSQIIPKWYYYFLKPLFLKSDIKIN